jgi:hypothetical protein
MHLGLLQRRLCEVPLALPTFFKKSLRWEVNVLDTKYLNNGSSITTARSIFISVCLNSFYISTYYGMIVKQVGRLSDKI